MNGGGIDPGDGIWLYLTQPGLRWRKSGEASWKKVHKQSLHAFSNTYGCLPF